MARSPGVPQWGGRRVQAALKRVKVLGRRDRTPCRRCKEPINYDLTYPDEWSCSVGHIMARETHPEHTWDPSNWAPEHLKCNKQGDAAQMSRAPDLGVVGAW